MQSKATTVADYIAELPPERRKAIQTLRRVFLDNLDKGFEEGMGYGAISYYVPHRIYPAGYHCDPRLPLPFAGLGSQKNHMSFGLFCLYCDEAGDAWFRDAWTKTGKKLDMGKSCVRFRKIEDVPLEVVAEAIRRVRLNDFITHYEQSIQPRTRGRSASRRREPDKTTSQPTTRARIKTTRTATKKRTTTAAKTSAKKKRRAGD